MKENLDGIVSARRERTRYEAFRLRAIQTKGKRQRDRERGANPAVRWRLTTDSWSTGNLQNVTKRRKQRAVALHFESRPCGVDGY
jgi:hypothetical protein